MTAEEILKYAEGEFERAVKMRDMSLYKKSVDKAFLSLITAVNSLINRKLGVTPRSHSERRSMLRKIGRGDLRALYSDVMKTLRDEAFYEGIYNPEEAEYAIKQVRKMFGELKKSKCCVALSFRVKY